MGSARERDAQIVMLYEKYFDLLVKYCRRHLGSDLSLISSTEDIVQETFMEALEKWDEITEHENVLGWLMRTCWNKASNLMKKTWRRGRQHVFSFDEMTEPSVEDRNSRIERIAEKKETSRHLEEILGILTDSEKRAVVDHYENMMTIPEMAEANQKSEGTYKAALRRARKKSKAYRDKKFLTLFLFCMVSFPTFVK